MDTLHAVYLILGFALLIGGAEWLVRGAAALAVTMGISPLVVGLTVVAFGTSAPELGVSLLSAFEGRSGIAVGNIVGSNMCNVLLILGLAALMRPLPISRRLIRRDVPLMIGAAAAMWLMALDGTYGTLDGLILFGSLLIYIGNDIRAIRRKNKNTGITQPAQPTATQAAPKIIAKDFLLVAAGLAAITAGSRLLVSGAVAMATAMGVSELVIGLTVIAIGTSLPEIATSVIAGIRGSSDIAVGNIVGSNLFNMMAVLGLTAAVAPGGVPVTGQAIHVDIPLMVLVMVICLPLFRLGMSIRRWEGGLLVSGYAGYMIHLILAGAS